MKLKWISTVFALEFLISIYFLYLFNLLDLKTIVSVGLVEMGAAIFIDFLNRRNEARRSKQEEESKQREKLEQERNRRREEFNGYIHEHNQMLIDTVIKPWLRDKFVSITKEPIAIEHLRTGYPNIWKLWFEECKGLQGCISEDKKKIKEYIKNKSSEGIPSYAELEDVFDDDNYIFKIDKEKFGGVSVGRTTERVIGYLDYFSRKGKFPKVGGSKEIIETIMKDPPLYERFKNVDKNTKLLNKKSNEFGQGLKEIVDDFKERHIELKGTCKDCNGWHDTLKSLG